MINGSFNLRTALAATNGKESEVQSVEVQLVVSGKVYDGLQDRIEYSIGRVGEKILLSQPISLLQKNEETVKTAIYNVFSKVLTGFKLDSVDLFLGEHTRVVIQLTPLPPLISKVRLQVRVKDVSPEIIRLIDELSLKVEDDLNQVLVGLPVASVSWSEAIVNLATNFLVEREFPGFSGRFEMKAGSETQLTLILTPRKPVVEMVKVHYASSSIPAWFLKLKVKPYQENFDILKGLPVEFVTHNQKLLEGQITRSLNELSEMQQWGMAAKLSITPGVQTEIKLAVDSLTLQTKLEARYFAGTDNSFGNFYTYLGYHTDDYELFARKFWGEYPGGDFKIGLKFPLASNLFGAFEYAPGDRFKDVWLHYQFERGDYLDLTMGLDDSPNEAVVGVKINDTVNLEFVKFQHQSGVQLMFHF
jgi:hypothetical protein